ncbi:hypothetical protein AMECASPLE_034865 [Ameca splendens]|uniref:Uncharacterized protein n=1 Tax=Ameca splendens TaxID=208324 RepID=A0ABV0ZS51_9TELE
MNFGIVGLGPLYTHIFLTSLQQRGSVKAGHISITVEGKRIAVLRLNPHASWERLWGVPVKHFPKGMTCIVNFKVIKSAWSAYLPFRSHIRVHHSIWLHLENCIRLEDQMF